MHFSCNCKLVIAFIFILKSFHKFYAAGGGASSFAIANIDIDDSKLFGYCLLQLRLPELLRLNNSLSRISEKYTILKNENYSSQINNKTNNIKQKTSAENCNNHESCEELPKAMALMGNNKRGYSTSYTSSYHPWQPEEKPSKLQTLFQISITALAFLSFGGYLLCLIVQAIKSKGTTYFHPVATATTTNVNGGIKRIKIYRRSRRHTTDNTPNYLKQLTNDTLLENIKHNYVNFRVISSTNDIHAYKSFT